MPKVDIEQYKDGDFLVDYEEKVFEDVKAQPGEKSIGTFHTVAFEGSSIGLVNVLQAKRLLRKGFETKNSFIWSRRSTGRTTWFSFQPWGLKYLLDTLAVNNQLKAFMAEGGEAPCSPFCITSTLWAKPKKH